MPEGLEGTTLHRLTQEAAGTLTPSQEDIDTVSSEFIAMFDGLTEGGKTADQAREIVNRAVQEAYEHISNRQARITSELETAEGLKRAEYALRAQAEENTRPQL